MTGAMTGAVAVGRAAGRGGGGRRSFGGQHGGDREHAGQPLDRSLARLAQGLLGRSLVRVDLEREADIAVPDHDTADQAAGDDILPAVRVRDIGQRRQNLFLGDRRHRPAPTPGSRVDAPARKFWRGHRCVRQTHDL